MRPELVGNRQRVLISDMAGRSSVFLKAKELGVSLDRDSEATKRLVEDVKGLEFEGYEFEAADGSLHLLLAKGEGLWSEHFQFESYRIIVEKRGEGAELTAEATIRIRVDGVSTYTVAECTGPIGALDKALRLALEKVYPKINEMQLRDYKVRILDSNRGSNARTRVLIESADESGLWGTVGVSDNIIEASWIAIRDSVEYKLFRDSLPPPERP